MSIPVNKLVVGETLYDVHSHRMGNTTMREEGCWTARVVEVHAEAVPQYALIAWNGNPPRKVFYKTNYKRWPKEWIRRAFHGRVCALCHGREDDGHKDTCEHPRAISKRKKAAKAERQATGRESGER